MEAPVDSDSEEGNDESLSFDIEDFEPEVDVNIHFHCEHCFNLKKCNERVKIGWSCEVEWCPNNCGQRFHVCKLEEHRYMCSEERIPCINSVYGCPLWLHRREISEHLPVCPASVVVCNAEWNRWALGAREREKVAISKGLTNLYKPSDLDMALALRDQELVNEMHTMPKRMREALCNGITRRFPCLPLALQGTRHECSPENDDLTPEKKPKKEQARDDSSLDNCCVHQIMKSICRFCRDDPDDPRYKMGRVWREKVTSKKPGEFVWIVQSCIEKVRKRNPFGVYQYKKYDESDEDEDEEKGEDAALDIIVDEKGRPIGRKTRFQTPPPAPLTPKGLTMELGVKHYSRHQTKPKAMFTFQCLQEVRRSEFGSHYQNIHCEIQEGLEGWILHRCPLHLLGCPYSVIRLHPGLKDSDVIYCDTLKAFGVRPVLDYKSAPIDGLPRSRSPSVEKTSSKFAQLNLKSSKREKNKQFLEVEEQQFLASSLHLTYLPVEVLITIASYLDGFSLNNLSRTCLLMRDICVALLNDRGLIASEWVRYIIDGKIRWKEGKKRLFFSKAIAPIGKWGFKSTPHMGDHLQVCLFNKKHISEEKFTYGRFKRPCKPAS